ncbi:MAG: C_GCAxxG_C_C family protein [Erysipelotrichaceae bacterium]|mgnify:CR=1 FL=1|jgi:C_GCAxxG_C_C family probable redox protein|nr:C_GCAxxG_C_C family protein [Erysipelotrichaceae bacterium]
MESKKEQAVFNFKHGHNCAQAVICAYSEDFHVDKETAYRLAEGFGSGIPGQSTICGAASGMVMCAGLKNCEKMDVEHTTKKITYPCVESMLAAFQERIGNLECKHLLQQDDELIDGKRAKCISYVSCACDIIEEMLYK